MDFTKLKAFCDRMAAERTPGCSVVVCIDGRVMYTYSAGYSNAEKRIHMNGNEYFNIYSCSKVATVTAGAQLVERGIILMNDPLYEYIPEWKDVLVKRSDGSLTPPASPITVGDLFSMSAGLNYDMNCAAYAEARKATNGKMNTDVAVRFLAKQPLCFDPNTRWLYSLCHDLLAGLISIVSGKPFREYMRENIFEPLGMNSTFYHATPEILDRMAEQYIFVPESGAEETDLVKAQSEGTRTKDGYFKNAGKRNGYILGDEYDSGGAGIITTVSDYAKLCGALGNRGLGANGERILSPATVELMKQNRLSESQLKEFSWNQPHRKGYGYAMGVWTHMDQAASGMNTTIGEFGWGGAAGATVVCDTNAGLGAFFVQHTLNPREEWYQPRFKNALYASLT